jgi:membrane-bound lytic murein transglycosylase F
VAINLTVTKERKKFLRFTHPIGQTRQVLVQRKPDQWWKMTRDAINKAMIRNPLDLAGKTIYVQKNSSYAERLKNLSDEIGDTIIVIELDMDVERIIKMVADGEIDYTVADENVAKVNSTYYSILDVETPISFHQNLAWALRKEGTDQLAQMVNSWIDSYRKTLDYAMIYKKYFSNPKSKVRVKSDYFVLGNGRISPYDDMIRRCSDSLGWDWRLLASMIYQESHFDPKAVSWAGAMGLMQIMPSTVKRYHVKNPFDPDENIHTGVKFLRWINSIFDETVLNEEERIKFILASYNTGQGHIKDAMRLAEKYGDDPTLWQVVREYLLKLSQEKYFLDPVVKYGYCRGDEPANYVDQILDRYEHYKNIVQE